MEDLSRRIEGLFENAEPPEDATGSLAALSGVFEDSAPRWFAAVGGAGEILAVHRPDADAAAEEIRAEAGAAARRLRGRGAFIEPMAGGGALAGYPTDGSGGGLVLVSLGRVPDGETLTPLAHTAARIAWGAIRTARERDELAGRVRHLQNEQEVLADSHGRIVAEMLESKDRQARQQARYVSMLESEVQKRSAALREALDAAEDANRAKSAFLANMSHEIRTPMTAILGYADLMLDPELTHEEVEEIVGVVRSNGEHLLQILNDILDISKIEARRLTIERLDFDVRQLVGEVITLLRIRAREKGLTVVAEFDPELPAIVRTDPTRLRQILVNLVGNALKFTELGGIRISCRAVRAGGRELLELEVIDTGPGMTEEQLEQLFQPFTQADSSTTRRFGGTGLGLSISRNLAILLGGSLVAESSPGKGSTFRASVRIDPE